MFAAMIAAGAALFLTGCGGGDGGDNPPANIAGTWQGPFTLTYKGQSVGGTTILVLTQDGSNISGTMGGGKVPTSGVVDGNSVALVSTSEFTYTWDLTADGDSMSGTFVVTGEGIDGQMDGTVSLTRVTAAGAHAEQGAGKGLDLENAAAELLKKMR